MSPRPNPVYVRSESRAPIIAYLDNGHTVADTARRFGYQPAAIKEVEAMVARQRAKQAASRARIDARMNPPEEIAAQIVAFWNEGRSEIQGHPGFFAAGSHSMREVYAKFDAVDPHAIDRIVRVRGAR